MIAILSLNVKDIHGRVHDNIFMTMSQNFYVALTELYQSLVNTSF